MRIIARSLHVVGEAWASRLSSTPTTAAGVIWQQEGELQSQNPPTDDSNKNKYTRLYKTFQKL